MLAFAITIRKSQGLSIKSAVIDAGPDAFGFGMTYVASSRVTSLAGLHGLRLTAGNSSVIPKVYESIIDCDHCTFLIRVKLPN